MRPDRLLLQDMLEAVEEVIDTTPSTMGEFVADKLVQPALKPMIEAILADSGPEEP